MTPLPPKPDVDAKPKLLAIALLNVSIAANPIHTGNISGAGFNAKLNARVLRPPEANRRQIQLQLDIEALENAALTPYVGSLTALAVVEFSKILEDEWLDKTALWVAINPLVGAARTYLDVITAVGPYGRILLNLVHRNKLISSSVVIDEEGGTARVLYPEAAAEPEASGKKISEDSSSDRQVKIRRPRIKP